MKLVLIRHGESEGNADTTIYCKKQDHLIELTKKGVEQSIEVGKELHEFYESNFGFDSLIFYVSPYVRTKQTFNEIIKPFYGLGYSVSESPFLIEQQTGNYRSEEELKKCREYGRFYYRFPTGENGLDVYNRCHSFIEKIKSKHKQNDVVFAVTHAYTMRVLRCIIEDRSLDLIDQWPKPENCETMYFNI